MRDVVEPAVPTSVRESGGGSAHHAIHTNADVEAASPALGAFPEITSGG